MIVLGRFRRKVKFFLRLGARSIITIYFQLHFLQHGVSVPLNQ